MGQLDVVIFGATGFTGRLAARWLVEHHPDLAVGLAGRSLGKLESVVAQDKDRWPKMADAKLIVADAFDDDSLDELVAQTQVVISTVGPFYRSGKQLVAACARAGVHYGDITGEPHFIAHCIHAHHEEAKATGARIVHACGFDSLPSDLGVLFLQQVAEKRFGAVCQRVDLLVQRIKGEFSGGTLHTMFSSFEEASDRTVRKALSDPYSLAPDHRGPDGRAQMKPVFDPVTGRWTGPFIMAPSNERVVRRTHGLLGQPWGQDFSYGEAMVMKSWGAAWSLAAALGGGAAMVATRPGRHLMKRFVRSPGEGPDEATREAGSFRLLLVGHANGNRVLATVSAEKDPGYGATAGMLAETGVALRRTEGPGGVLTPGYALGSHGFEALANVLSFEDVTDSFSP